MTEPYDPYRQNPNPYGQPGPQGQQPYGGQYGPQQGGQPYPGQQPPYGGKDHGGQYGQGQYGGGQYGGQPGGQHGGGSPYGQPGGQGQGGGPGSQYGQPGGYGQQPDQTRQFDPYGTQQYDQYGAQQQQPYQGSYGQPSGWSGPPGGGYPPAPPPRSKTPMVLIAVLAVVILVGGGIAAVLALRGDDPTAADPGLTAAPATTTPGATTTRRSSAPPTTTAAGGANDFEVGQCATLTPEENNRATIRVTECGGALSDVVIAKIESGECAEPYLSFNPGEGKVYCLAMDAKEGDCFRLDQLIKRALACVGDEARKVVKIYDGVADDAKCTEVAETVDVYAYPDPAKTLCLGKADF